MKLQSASVLLLCVFLSACGGSKKTQEAEETRSFKMGFTPWLYEASFAAQTLVYDEIQNNGDIVSHHLMGGIPWQEAFDQTAYPTDVENEIATRLNKTVAGKSVYLSIDSLNGLRTELAPNWGSTENEPRTGAWATRDFDSPEVITAYTNFALDMIGRFNPDYFNYAVEISVLMFGTPATYDKFVTFSAAVYTNIKAVHPNLPMLVSLSLKTPDNAEMQKTKADFARIKDYVDVVGISVYPYAFYDHTNKGDPATMPTDWLSQISTLAPNKPIAITEVGWAAEDLVIPSFSINVPVTAAQQNQFLNELFEQATNHNALFVIWFCLYDYDTLWSTVLASGDIARIWRDIGFYDGSLNPRASFDTWQTWYKRPLTN